MIPVYDDKIIIHTPDGSSAYVQTGNFREPIKVSLLGGNKKPDGAMPNLMETFNNYMKEHYETEVSSTENIATISPVGPEYLQYKSKDDGQTLALNRESVDAISLLESPLSKKPAMEEVEKILATAPIQSSTPTIVKLTLPPEPTPANQVSSGLIAGYVEPSKEPETATPAFDLLTQIPFSALPIVKQKQQQQAVPEVSKNPINEVISQLQDEPLVMKNEPSTSTTQRVTTLNSFKEKLSTLTTKKFEKIESPVTRPSFKPPVTKAPQPQPVTLDKSAGRINLEEEKIKQVRTFWKCCFQYTSL